MRSLLGMIALGVAATTLLVLDRNARTGSADLGAAPRKTVDAGPRTVAPKPEARKSTEPHGNPAFVQHVEHLTATVPEGFTVVGQHPFAVIGDESPEVVQQRATSTVKWATDRLKQLYFPNDPDRVINVWLFKDKASYERNTRALFDDTPTTPFGYFSHKDAALIMNIATGGGTLVHEMVHAFMAANFPECPAWFNEGLASLYEQCGDNGGRIWGYTNWRLAGLQKTIAANRTKLASFEKLCHTTSRQFYDADPGTYYAQARYLCYYLQQHELLDSFYQRFRRDVRNDPSGYKTLVAVLGVDDMDEFQTRWENWVLGLRFP